MPGAPALTELLEGPGVRLSGLRLETGTVIVRIAQGDAAVHLRIEDGAAFDPARNLDVEIGYGIGAFGGRGVLVPYLGFATSGGDSRELRTGARLRLGSLDAEFRGGVRERASGEPDRFVGLKLRLPLGGAAAALGRDRPPPPGEASGDAALLADNENRRPLAIPPRGAPLPLPASRAAGEVMAVQPGLPGKTTAPKQRDLIIPPFWTEEQTVSFRGQSYRIVSRLGSGGAGTTFKVVEVDSETESDLGTYVAKVARDEQLGQRVLGAYKLARSHLRHSAPSLDSAGVDYVNTLPAPKMRSRFVTERSSKGAGDG